MEKKYFHSIDILRSIAILAVVGIHTSTQTFAASGFNANDFTLSIFINQILRFAVPLFFAISGFSLTVSFKEGNILSFYKKRVSKVILPYVIWSLFYWNFVYVNHGESFPEALLKGSASYQLYFIPSLLIFYLIFPYLMKFYNFISGKVFLITAGLIEIYLLYQDYFIKPLEINHAVKIVILNLFVFILGIIAARNYKKLLTIIEKYKIFIFSGTIIAAFYVFFEGSGLYRKNGNYLDIYSQWRPSVLIYTILIGSLLFYFFEKYKSENNFLNKVSQYSFFIYFSHIAVLEFIWHTAGKYMFHLPLFDIWFLANVFLISLGLGFLFHKFPKVRLVSG